VLGPADGETLLARIASNARPAGSAAEAEARAVCASSLALAGFVVEERPFSYSALPGRFGTPVAGLCLLVSAVIAVQGILRGGVAMDRGIATGIGLVLVVAVTGWWLGRYGTRRLRIFRERGLNLEARRGVPRVWLVAHLDSKSQPISLLTRAAASVGVVASWLCLIIAWAASRVTTVPPSLLLGLATCGAVASVPLLLSRVGTRGTGALDNASGVAAILRAASIIDPGIPVGVLVTSAEELGLAGARAWVEKEPTAVAINCDGVDDGGVLTVTAASAGRHLLQTLRAAGMVSSAARIRRVLPGVLMDSSAFADEGWPACTVSKGTRRSLARVHTANDTLDRVSGKGVEDVAAMIASLAGAIIACGSSPEVRKGGC